MADYDGATEPREGRKGTSGEVSRPDSHRYVWRRPRLGAAGESEKNVPAGTAGLDGACGRGQTGIRVAAMVTRGAVARVQQ